MQITKTVDIIIPSFRLDAGYLLPLIQLPKPDGWTFKYYIIVDNPSITVPHSIQNLSEENIINLFINPENLGASASRNKGIDAGTGEWILFLDDDIIADENLLYQYTKAIEDSPNEIGFIGLTDFPPTNNEFTRALEAADLTSIFKIAENKDYFTWGVTANMMYRRSAMQELRFSHIFPKSGGGEDIDLPLRICIRQNKEFKCLKEAKVTHPWWNDGQPHYNRFIRYGVGTGYLFPLYKKLTWYDFPNMVESLFILVISAPFLLFFLGWLVWVKIFFAIILIEYIFFYLQFSSKGIKSVKTILYIALLKTSLTLGILKTILKEKQLGCFMKRINVGYPNSHNFHLNKWKIIKMVLFITFFLYLITTKI